jgi:hypothetical protein
LSQGSLALVLFSRLIGQLLHEAPTHEFIADRATRKALVTKLSVITAEAHADIIKRLLTQIA